MFVYSLRWESNFILLYMYIQLSQNLLKRFFSPVPFILFLVPAIFRFMRRHNILVKMVDWLENKAQKGAKKIEKYAVFGLFLFVAIPLPGTGAWTGSLAASVFGMKKSWALISVFLGVLAAGAIMTLASYGIVSAFKFFAK